MVEYGITYKVYVKQISYQYVDSEICDEFTHNDVSTERTVTVTVTVTCNRPLQGEYIEIVALSPSETTLKVFEIERLGMFTILIFFRYIDGIYTIPNTVLIYEYLYL